MHNQPHTDAAKAKMSAARKGKAAPWKHRPIVIADGVTLYCCGRCTKFFPKDHFYSERRTILGIKTECKACHSKVSLETRDPDTTRAIRRRSEAVRRARKAGCAGAVSQAEWEQVLTILGTACLCCGSIEEPTQDHIVPLARGGLHHPSNLQPLCRPCNERKQARAFDYRTERQRQIIEDRWVVSFDRIADAIKERDRHDYADHWRPLYHEGLSPQQAFRRALDAFAAERRNQERLQAENWRRIQDEDAAFAQQHQAIREEEGHG